MVNPIMQPVVFVEGIFDNIKTGQIRFLEEASKLGNVHVLLFSDKVCKIINGKKPNFPENERRYYLESIRFVSNLTLINTAINCDEIPLVESQKNNWGVVPIWAVQEYSANIKKKDFCRRHGMQYHIIAERSLVGFPGKKSRGDSETLGKKKVAVSGCFDWVHSGHIRFFEEVSTLGDLYVIIGHDDNLRLLKGEGHPMYPQNERLYWVKSIRFVKQALVSSGNGWLDAEPQIIKIKPDIFAVNEDGDKPEKRRFCLEHQIKYKVFKRKPKPGLPARISTDLRGF